MWHPVLALRGRDSRPSRSRRHALSALRARVCACACGVCVLRQDVVSSVHGRRLQMGHTTHENKRFADTHTHAHTTHNTHTTHTDASGCVWGEQHQGVVLQAQCDVMV